MKSIINFTAPNFGGYTLSILLSGLFLGYTTKDEWYYIIASLIMFFIGSYFYAKDNEEEQ